MSTPFGKFFLPGPTEVRPEILAAQAKPMMGHRSSKTEDLLGRMEAPLKAVFRTERPVMMAAASATGFMEAGIRNGVRQKVLCLVNGAFSQRFADIAKACGKETLVEKVPEGETFEAPRVRELLARHAPDAVTIVHSESATGALSPIAEISAAVHEAGDVMLIVDGVTSVAGSPVEFDQWRLDFLVTGSQKAMALPPGLAFGVASERMMARARTIPGRGIYFDLVPYDEQIRKRQTPYTPAVSLLYALAAQVELIATEGIENRWKRHDAMRSRVEQWVAQHAASLGIGMLPREGRRSWTVSCVKLPEGGQAGTAVSKAMSARGITIASGYGKNKETTFRIGHMGDHTVAELEVVLENLTEVLRG